MLRGETVVKVESAERHHAMVNFWRTSVSCILGTLFWLWTGWTSGSGAMVMIAVVTALAMRLPNPAYGGDRLPLWHPGGVTVGHLVLPGDHAGDAAEHAVALHQPGGDGVLLSGSKYKKRRLGSLGRWRAPSTFWCWITRCSSSSASSSIARWGRSSAVSSL